MLLRWKIAVGSEIPSSLAISLFICPWTISLRTSFSRSESLSTMLRLSAGIVDGCPYLPVACNLASCWTMSISGREVSRIWNPVSSYSLFCPQHTTVVCSFSISNSSAHEKMISDATKKCTKCLLESRMNASMFPYVWISTPLNTSHRILRNDMHSSVLESIIAKQGFICNNYLTRYLLQVSEIAVPLHSVISFSVINYVVSMRCPTRVAQLIFFIPTPHELF